jgi:hypothetical protein
MFVEPLGGWRFVTATRRRRGVGWAGEVKRTVMEEYPQAEKAVMGKG